MKENSETPIAFQKLTILKQNLEAWRQSGKKHRRIPEYFWKQALALLSSFSASQIAHSLLLNYSSLKRRASRLGNTLSDSVSYSSEAQQPINLSVIKDKFIEITAAVRAFPVATSSCIAKIKIGKGKTLCLYRGDISMIISSFMNA